MLLDMPKLNKKFKKLKKEGGPQFLSLTCYLQVKWWVQPSLVFNPPPQIHKYRCLFLVSLKKYRHKDCVFDNLQVKWLVQPSLVFNPPPPDSQIQMPISGISKEVPRLCIWQSPSEVISPQIHNYRCLFLVFSKKYKDSVFDTLPEFIYQVSIGCQS